jgi:hypothetical protein
VTRALGGLAVVVLAVGTAGVLDAQQDRGNAQPAQTPREAAPIDLTGYWVSIVTQDWRWRMVTPAKGDYQGIPLTPEGRKVTDAWDPARDEAAGEECRSYGAPALMSVPGRLHITWEDDRTLRVETDAGMQTRLFHFGGRQPAPETPPSWQGVSVAEWLTPRPTVPLILRPAARTAGEEPVSGPRGGSLSVVTRNLRPGYLRKNGVPYSADAVVTEHWDLFVRENGDEWLTITTRLDDPVYLRTPRLLALPFKKEPDGAKWNPTPCSARW